MRTAPRIYNLFPLLAGPIAGWSALLPNIARMGFDTVFVNPFHQTGFSGSLYAVQDYRRLDPRIRGAAADDDAALGGFTEAADRAGLRVMMDLVANHTSRDSLLASDHPDWYMRGENGEVASPFAVDPVDPSKRTVWGDLAELDWHSPHRSEMIRYFASLLRHYSRLGFLGFRCDAAYKIPGEAWQELIQAAKSIDAGCFFCAETLGCTPAEVRGLSGAGFDYLFNSVKWWDARAPWFLEQHELYRTIAPSIGFPESHDTERLAAELSRSGIETADVQKVYERRYLAAAALSAGIMVPMGYETGATKQLNVVSTVPADIEAPAFDLAPYLASVNHMKATIRALNEDGPMTLLSKPGDSVVILAKWSEAADDLVFILIGGGLVGDGLVGDGLIGDGEVDVEALFSVTAGDVVDLTDVTPGHEAPVAATLRLEPGDVRVLHANFIKLGVEPAEPPAKPALPPRLVIENVYPEIDGGRFPVKRIQGDTLEVWADIFRDGHDKIAAAIRLKQANGRGWTLVPMALFDNDRWVGRVRLDAIGMAEYTIEAWTDHFASWRDEVSKKRAAGVPIGLELEEGRLQLAAAVERADGRHRDRLVALLASYETAATEAAGADLLLSRAVANAIALSPDKSDRVLYEPTLRIMVDREAARFSAWYEMFPRSQATDPDSGANFADCTARLPYIKDLGFDVVYLVPIHPIGEVNRKGRDNNPKSEPGEPGSPYAVGSRFGGHKDVSPELGTLDDFRAFHIAVHALDMELALDFAVQCAPDHPWVKQHPNWFKRRPDGTMKYAENPPKKYEDIVNVDFDQPDWRSLWDALLDAVMFWAEEGVRIFRIDNPHTKPVAFWEWLIANVTQRFPDTLFLAEAFTRPKMMGRLGKIGFSQSYTYFTWRNTKAELTEYLTQLTKSAIVEYYRPNFFANTPDILPLYLQTSGRPGFIIRLVLAATLSGSYGIYNGYELCEADAVPGKEEYAHSEKYQYKVWDWDRAGNITAEIRALNLLRRDSAALRLFTNLTFCWASHESVLLYMKRSPDGSDTILVAVNLDPHESVRSEIDLPFGAMGLPPGTELHTAELFSGERGVWHGSRHTIDLDPQVNPAMVWRVISPPA